jgi:GntR family transcriptional regulator
VETIMTFSSAAQTSPFPELTDPSVDLSSTHAPIYRQLSTLFRKFIVRNQWLVGERIPNLDALAAQFGVNPATVRKAITVLETEGLLECSRRRGTSVVAKPLDAHRYEVATNWRGAVHSYDGLALKLLKDRDVRNIPAEINAHSSPARRYHHLRRLYRRGRVSLIVEDSYLDERTCQKVGRVELRNTPAIKLVDRFVKVRHAIQSMRFGIADSDMSQLLSVPLNAPLAMIHLSVDDQRSVRCFDSTAYIRGDAIRVFEPILFGKND